MGRDLYTRFCGAMAYIEVMLPNGNISIGSAFHVGEGVFITARHVVDKNTIMQIATTEKVYIPDENGNTTINGEKKYTTVWPKNLTLKSGPFFHPNDKTDIAAIIVEEKNTIEVPLGAHLDDWIVDSEFILRETIIMGYPPIPFAEKPLLISAKGEINAVVDKYNTPHPHFIISAMPRGGFSGGLCVVSMGSVEDSFALGVIVESLTTDNRDTESGFMSVLSIEPIFVCLQYHKIIPESQNYWIGDI